MGIRDWFSGRSSGDSSPSPRRRWAGTTGNPPSGNGASSFHVMWDEPEGAWRGAEVTFEVVDPPSVARLFFWAMQVSFRDEAGRDGGGAHLGLQWFASHPGSTAVNWGGYDAAGRELRSPTSALSSTPGNVNTRDFPWRVGVPYRLRVWCVSEGVWEGSVTEVSTGELTVIRQLWAPGDRVGSPMVWSEVFAACDDAGTAVRWSHPVMLDHAGTPTALQSGTVNYQSLTDGGCVTTDTSVEDDAVLQRTGVARTTAQGTRLTLGRPGS